MSRFLKFLFIFILLDIACALSEFTTSKGLRRILEGGKYPERVSLLPPSLRTRCDVALERICPYRQCECRDAWQVVGVNFRIPRAACRARVQSCLDLVSYGRLSKEDARETFKTWGLGNDTVVFSLLAMVGNNTDGPSSTQVRELAILMKGLGVHFPGNVTVALDPLAGMRHAQRVEGQVEERRSEYPNLSLDDMLNMWETMENDVEGILGLNGVPQFIEMISVNRGMLARLIEGLVTPEGQRLPIKVRRQVAGPNEMETSGPKKAEDEWVVVDREEDELVEDVGDT